MAERGWWYWKDGEWVFRPEGPNAGFGFNATYWHFGHKPKRSGPIFVVIHSDGTAATPDPADEASGGSTASPPGPG